MPAGPAATEGKTMPPAANANDRADVIFADDAARRLLNGGIDRLDDPGAAGWEKVKQNASRTVWRGRIDGQGVYVKHFHNHSLFHDLLRRAGHFESRRELRFMRLLSDRQVPTAPPLAARCDRNSEWVATRAVEPVTPGDQWHEQQLRQGPEAMREIRRATRSLGRMIGRMHAAGVLHKDLHCGNVLVTSDPRGKCRLVLTDLHRVARRRLLSRRAKAINLAQLFHDRHDFTTRSDRLRFLRAYIEASGSKGSLRGWQILVEHFGRRHRSRQHRQRDRRICGNNKYFHKLSLGRGWKGHVVLASKRKPTASRAAEMEFTPEQWRQVLQTPEKLFEGQQANIVKDTRSGMVARTTLTLGANQVEVFVKRPRRKRRWKLLLDCLRSARPIRHFRLGHALLTRRVATALPLAALERRVGPFLLDCILITEAVRAPVLDEFFETWLGDPPKGDVPLSAGQQHQLAQEVLWQLGRMLQILHDNQFAHRDLKATNILVLWSPGLAPEICLLDLDGLKRVWLLTEKRRCQGLMRLNVSLLQCPSVSHAGRLRMLLGYLRRPGSGRIRYKPYWRVLERWSAKKLRKQIRSRRRRQRANRRPVA
jgi:tRNA A-37 threonylcarbamoyl transferase component Bud32